MYNTHIVKEIVNKPKYMKKNIIITLYTLIMIIIGMFIITTSFSGAYEVYENYADYSKNYQTVPFSDYCCSTQPTSVDLGYSNTYSVPGNTYNDYYPVYTSGSYPIYSSPISVGFNYSNWGGGLNNWGGNYIPTIQTIPVGGAISSPSYNYYVNNNTPAQPTTYWCQYTNSYINSNQSCNNPCTSNQYWNGSYCVNNYSQYCSINGQTYYNQSDYNNYCKQNTVWCQYTNSYIYSYQSCNNPCTYNQYWNGSYCVNNNPILQVTTNSVSNITTNSAVCNGSVYNSNNNYLSGYFEYGQNQVPAMTTNVINIGNNVNTQYTGNLVNLSPNTTYYCRAVAINNNGNRVYGSWVSFTTNIAYKPVAKTPKAKAVTKIVYVPTPTPAPKKEEKKKDCDDEITTIKLKTNKDNKVALSINGEDTNNNTQTPVYYNNAMAQGMSNPYNPYMNNNGYNNNPYNNNNDNNNDTTGDDSVVPNTLLGWLGFVIMIIVLMLLLKNIKDKYSNQNRHISH